MQPNLPASTNTTKTGLTANGNGVLTIAPKNSSESGSNATLGKFVSGYKGLELTSSTLQYPGKPVYTNGDVCPKGTPDAGKPGVVIVDSWPNFESKGKGTETSGDPQDLLVRQRPAHHHGLRAGHRLGAQAAGLGHHQPDHRRCPGHDHDHGADHHAGTPHDRSTTATTADAPPPTTATTAATATTTHHVEEIRRNAPSESRRPGGRRGHAPPAADPTTPKQMLPIVEQPMIERVLGHLAEPRDRRGRPVPRLPARRLHQRLPRRHHRRGAAVLRRRARARSTRPAPSGSPPGTPASTRPSWWSTATCSPTSTSPALVAFHRHRGAEATISLTPVDDPSALRRGPHRRRRTGRGLHREAAPGRGPDQPDQRRHLRPRAVGAGPHPRGSSGSRSSARPSRPWSRRAPCSPWARDAYWLDTGTPDAYLRAHRDLLARPAGRTSRPRGRARPGDRARGVAHRRGRRAERRR